MFIPFLQLLAVGRRGWTFIRSGPCVAKDVTGLEIIPIGRFLEHQVFWKVGSVVANVETDEEHVLCLRHGASMLLAVRALLPKDAQALQFFS